MPFSLTDSVAPAAGAAITPGLMVGSVTGAGASAAVGEASAGGGLSVPASWAASSPVTAPALSPAHAQMYQAVSAQAAAIHEAFVNTLSTSSGSYAATEAANAAAAL
ncbi:PE domain-containing protein [Mycobacterium avium]|uniref:PE domain-containing protein n=1 Tax=Mycobacterium avium TaxID=1764 RepID=UPI00373FE239